jgi:hypothetical protein
MNASTWKQFHFQRYTHIFLNPISLSHNAISNIQPTTSDKFRQKLSEMRVGLTRAITNWSFSGQGEGAADDEAFGCTKQMKAAGNDDRSNFVTDNTAYLIYLWELAEAYEILPSAVQVMDASIGVPTDELSHNISSLLKKKTK